MPVLTALENVELPLLLTAVRHRAQEARPDRAARGRPRGPHGPLPAPAVGRAGAARGDRARDRQRPDHHDLRRADRRSRPQGADEILALLEKLNREFKKTILMVTHDPAAAERATITRRLDKGQLLVTRHPGQAMIRLLLIAARNLRRNKLRTFLTVLGVAVAILAFVMLRTVLSAWNVAAEYAAKDRIGTRHKVSFVMRLPKRYIDDIRGGARRQAGDLHELVRRQGPEPTPTTSSPPWRSTPPTFFEVYDEIVVAGSRQAALAGGPEGRHRRRRAGQAAGAEGGRQGHAGGEHLSRATGSSPSTASTPPRASRSTGPPSGSTGTT